MVNRCYIAKHMFWVQELGIYFLWCQVVLANNKDLGGFISGGCGFCCMFASLWPAASAGKFMRFSEGTVQRLSEPEGKWFAEHIVWTSCLPDLAQTLTRNYVHMVYIVRELVFYAVDVEKSCDTQSRSPWR